VYDATRWLAVPHVSRQFEVEAPARASGHGLQSAFLATDGGHGGVRAIVEADAHQGIRVEGPWQQHVALEQPQLGLPARELVTAHERPEDWARGLTIAFRSPDLWATVVHDDSPLEVGEPIELRRAVAH
jgi:hypothetical protein